MKRLILIDLSGLFWSAWHATENMEVSEAFERTVRRVHSLRQGFDLCAVACDAPPYLRKKLSDSYKAHRDAHPPMALEQLTRVKERLVADGLLLWSSPGHEADDVIATAVQRAIADELAVVVASSDKDLFSLVDDARNVSVLTLSTGEMIQETGVLARFGVSPVLMPELLALMGDRSDNIPGVPGVAEKTGANLLKLHGPTAEDVIARADEIKTEKLRNAVLSSVDAIRLARQLVQLDVNVPIKWEELYEERKPVPLTKASDWTDADFEEDEKEEPMAAEAQKQPEPKPEPREITPHVIDDEPRAKALAIVRPQEWSMALEPSTPKAAWIVACKLYDSRLYQKFTSAEAIFAVMLRGRALGLDATTALDLFHFFKGKPTMHASLIVGLVLRSKKAEYFELAETTHERATWVTKRHGAKREVSISWSMEDAHRSGLVELVNGKYRGRSQSGEPSNWDKIPRTMLRHRAGTELARAVYPDIVAGLYDPEELGGEAIEPELEVA